ncbi:MAG TPA: hypothetical protein PLX69_04460 [Leptospiraceae bacterium]|nr:hypothetical protein [Leptospiraceae bacterium]
MINWIVLKPMKVSFRVIVLIVMVFMSENCNTDSKDSEESNNIIPKKPSQWIVPLYSLSWLLAHRTYDYKDCLVSTETFIDSSCENAEVVAQNDCKSDKLQKGTIKFLKYKANINENLSLSITPPKYYYPNNSNSINCISVYKENTMVDSKSPVANLEPNQSTSGCQSQTSVAMTAGSYRCISIRSACDSSYMLRLSDIATGLTVSGSGTANTTLPSAWAATTTTYTSIVGKRALVGYSSSTTVIPIGFNFIYFGQTYSNTYVSVNGILSFGSTAMTSNGDKENLFGSATYYYGSTNTDPILKSVIAPWWYYGSLEGCDAYVQYTTTGSAPNRVFTVEWNDLYSAGSYRNFQTKLYETTNVIELIYGSGANSGSSAYKASIGISNSVGGTGNYVNGKNGSSTDSSYSSFPPSGTVYRFTP